MSNYDKFLEKLLQKPTRTDITFEETYNFLTSDRLGFESTDNGGSHCKFRKDGRLLTIPRKPLKSYMIKQIIEVLQDLELI